MARYLVTGGAGFIGSHLVDALINAGEEVVVLDDFSSGKRENVNAQAIIAEGSLLDRPLVRDILDGGIDGCFHLAAKPIVQDSISNWTGCTQVNLLGSVGLFEELSRENGNRIPVVYASSCAVYGATGRRDTGLKETDPLDPQSPYAVDKYGCELHARAGGITRGLKSLGARFFNVFGERQDPRSPYSGVVSKFCQNLQQGKPLLIFGDGEQTRDFIHVSDIVDLLRRSLSKASVESPVLNFGTGMAITVNQLANTLARLSEQEIPIENKAGRPGEVRDSKADLARLKSVFGDVQFGDFSENLKTLFRNVSSDK